MGESSSAAGGRALGWSGASLLLAVPVLILLLGLIVAAASCAPAAAEPGAGTPGPNDPLPPVAELDSRVIPVVGTKGMVSVDDEDAARWGVEILRRGGNAVDAAVATAFALAVTRPHWAAVGGGGFMVYCPAPEAGYPVPCRVIDYRERAPSSAHRDLFVREGKAVPELSRAGALASGVPGVVAGLLTALERHGTRKRAELLARPIELARKGIRFTSYMEATARERWESMNDEARRLFGCAKPGAKVPKAPCTPGSLLRQPDLAGTLEAVARGGRDGFYKGATARKIVSGLGAAGGIIAVEDLAGYEPASREPVVGRYRDLEVVSMPPPSAGGSGILQMLAYAEMADGAGELAEGYGSARAIHAIAHGMSLAFSDRAQHFGDPDHWRVPLADLLSKGYLSERWEKTFKAGRANLPEGPGLASGEKVSWLTEHPETTHFSVIDRHGNAVALTTTVNDWFGSAFVPPGTGIVMNNEMDDFAAQPGVPNLFGLVGAEANAVAPGKRPLSSMSPTIVRDLKGNARIMIGAAGGPTITTSVFLSLVNRIRFGMSLPDAVAAPRFHQQWRPEALSIERNGFPAEVRKGLEERGYKLKEVGHLGLIYAIERHADGRVWGVPDSRAGGVAAAE